MDDDLITLENWSYDNFSEIDNFMLNARWNGMGKKKFLEIYNFMLINLMLC